MDKNNYYPFGMNHLAGGMGSAVFDPVTVPYNYKYNGKELQETGAYDYGWRMYMPDIARWNGMDQLAEDYISHSPYAYVMNNPISFYDPDGRSVELPDWLQKLWDKTNSYSEWTSNGYGGFNGGEVNGGISPEQYTSFYNFLTGGGTGMYGYWTGTASSSGYYYKSDPTVMYGDGDLGVLHWINIKGYIDNNFNIERNEFVDNILNNDYYDLGSLGLEESIARTGSYLTKALETKSTVNFTVMNKFAKPAFRTNVVGSMLSTSKITNVAKGLKVVGNSLAVVGVVAGGYQYATGQISGKEFAVDTIMAGVGVFGGPIGAAASLLYFGGKAIYEYQTGEKLFDAP